MSWGSILSTGLNIFGAISSKKAGDKAAALNERLTDAQVAALDQQTAMLGEQYGIEKGVRSNLLNKIYEYQAVLDNVQKELGARDIVSDADIAAEQGRRYRTKMDSANKALSRAGSLTQSELINRGLDNSTMAVQAQRELADKGSELYDQAYTSSYDEALQFLTNRDNLFNQSRTGAIDEKRGIYDSSINALGSTIGSVNPTAYTGASTGYGNAANTAGAAASSAAGAFGSALDDLLYGKPKRVETQGGLVNYLDNR